MSEPGQSERVEFRAMGSSAEDLGLFKECFDRNGQPRGADRLRWQYGDNPTGKVFVDVGEVQGHGFAAIYAVQPVRAKVHGSLQLAVQSLDTLTDERFRGRGLFVKMASSVFARATEEDVAFVYGFPNGNSAHGFFKKLGWVSLDPVPFIVRPLRTAYVIEKLTPWLSKRGFGAVGGLFARAPTVVLPCGKERPPAGVEIRSFERFDDSHSAIWQSFSRSIPFAVERDARYLNWRLGDKPGGEYSLFEARHQGRPVAFVAFAVRSKHQGSIGYLMDVVFEEGHQREGLLLLRRAIREMIERGADAALAWCFPHSPNRALYNRLGFFSLPERIRPIELHMGARPLAMENPAELARRENWYISYLDADTS